MKNISCITSFLIILLFSCTTTSPGLFSKKTPHEQYSQRLTDAGLKETALGRGWFLAAEKSLAQPLGITLPYKETGYFAAERPQAAGLRFSAKRGEKISATLVKNPAKGFLIYMELWQADEIKNKLLQSADTTGRPLEFEIEKDGIYILRLQPELLQSGEYTVTIHAGPSLAYPIKASGTNHIKSFWGMARDGGTRKHEGIDMFAPFRTPVVAAADGRVTNVSENNLGGKVVFMRPYNKDYSLYYAHLDEQLVEAGQSIKTGDTLGLMGKTGNARTTDPHLHFGIYTSGGAIDPLPFVNQVIKKPTEISASLTSLGKYVRTGNQPVKIYNEPLAKDGYMVESNALLKVDAAAAGFYKIELPDGNTGFVNSTATNSIKTLRVLKLTASKPLLDKPDTLAPKKIMLQAGESVSVFAAFKGFYYVGYEKNLEGWITK